MINAASAFNGEWIRCEDPRIWNNWLMHEVWPRLAFKLEPRQFETYVKAKYIKLVKCKDGVEIRYTNTTPSGIRKVVPPRCLEESNLCGYKVYPVYFMAAVAREKVKVHPILGNTCFGKIGPEGIDTRTLGSKEMDKLQHIESLVNSYKGRTRNEIEEKLGIAIKAVFKASPLCQPIVELNNLIIKGLDEEGRDTFEEIELHEYMLDRKSKIQLHEIRMQAQDQKEKLIVKCNEAFALAHLAIDTGSWKDVLKVLKDFDIIQNEKVGK